MNTADEMSEVLDRVKDWPPPSRIILARRILESLETPAVAETGPEPPPESPTRGVPVESLVGLLGTDREPPDDEECRRIVEEERLKEYDVPPTIPTTRGRPVEELIGLGAGDSPPPDDNQAVGTRGLFKADGPRGLSAKEVRSLFKTNRPAPDDATMKRWVDEHRTEKYG